MACLQRAAVTTGGEGQGVVVDEARIRIVHLVFGPPEHGVTRHALDLARAAGQSVLHLAATLPTDPALVLDQVRAGTGPDVVLHLHVTDHLLGRTPDEAAQLVEALAALRRISVTLHDLPQDSDGIDRFRRRSLAYARIVRVATGVQLGSRHEQALLRGFAPWVEPVVVPLPVEHRVDPQRLAAARRRARARLDPPTVGVLGYLYPGKGHAEVLAALDRLGRPDIEVVALGRPSPGHEWLVNDLTRLAGRRRFEVTGYLDDPALDDRILAIDVPVMAPTHVSASGSVLRWIGSGRRPVVAESAYTRELDAAMPGAVRLTDDLPTAIGRALAAPDDTWQTSRFSWDATHAAAAQTAAITTPSPDRCR